MLVLVTAEFIAAFIVPSVFSSIKGPVCHAFTSGVKQVNFVKCLLYFSLFLELTCSCLICNSLNLEHIINQILLKQNTKMSSTTYILVVSHHIRYICSCMHMKNIEITCTLQHIYSLETICVLAIIEVRFNYLQKGLHYFLIPFLGRNCI